MDVRVRRALRSDMDTLLRDMRPESRREIIALHPGKSLADVLGTIDLHRAEVGLADGRLVIVAGAEPCNGLLSGDAVAWAVLTEAAADYPRALARYSRRWVTDLLTRWDRLHTYADPRNERALRWLPWLGFRAMGTVEVEPGLHFVHLVAEG